MAQPQAQGGNIFDQVANSMGVSSAPATTAGSQNSGDASQQNAPASSPASGGNIFDQVAAQHDGSFQAPASGHTIKPGTIVRYAGRAGVAQGINPKTGKMIVDF